MTTERQKFIELLDEWRKWVRLKSINMIAEVRKELIALYDKQTPSEDEILIQAKAIRFKRHTSTEEEAQRFMDDLKTIMDVDGERKERIL